MAHMPRLDAHSSSSRAAATAPRALPNPTAFKQDPGAAATPPSMPPAIPSGAGEHYPVVRAHEALDSKSSGCADVAASGEPRAGPTPGAASVGRVATGSGDGAAVESIGGCWPRAWCAADTCSMCRLYSDSCLAVGAGERVAPVLLCPDCIMGVMAPAQQSQLA